ncbi:RNA polymerase sigma factor SigF [Frankia sp. Mgl5]|uniref:RNA polymerase sigma factor SigF n=1 Tax=Frankia sp. Mgl5 TaxID=2933793 RepID=UPI00201072AF|nr:RNA polymerase sigma factor SigF [Frankia sp. Mgl5]MCK9926133.1 RNA polymerase sigma factor SigF [Frankia sp. Mgl5]
MTSAGRTPTTPRTVPTNRAGDPVVALSQRGAGDIASTDIASTDVASTDVASADIAGPDVGGITGTAHEADGLAERGSGPGAEHGGPPPASAVGEQAQPDEAIDAAGAGSRSGSSGHGAGSPDRIRARALFVRLVSLPEGDPERAALRDQLVRMHLPLVEYLARRFRNRGEPLDDLVQVATIGLIKSVDRFDPERGVEFSTYATPTIVGEIKRHFRDKGWAIRVPRRLQELKLSLTKATSELSQSLGRSPTVSEIARHLEMSEEEVLEGLESANAYSAVSLDAPDSGDDEAPAVADTLGVQDESLEGVEYRESLKPLLEKLPPREKRILLLRFFGNMTQSQIANELGISQMHVSRLLARTLAQLRRGLLEDG